MDFLKQKLGNDLKPFQFDGDQLQLDYDSFYLLNYRADEKQLQVFGKLNGFNSQKTTRNRPISQRDFLTLGQKVDKLMFQSTGKVYQKYEHLLEDQQRDSFENDTRRGELQKKVLSSLRIFVKESKDNNKNQSNNSVDYRLVGLAASYMGSSLFLGRVLAGRFFGGSFLIQGITGLGFGLIPAYCFVKTA